MLLTTTLLTLGLSAATYGLALPQPYDANIAAILADMPEADFGMAAFNSSGPLHARNDPIPDHCQMFSGRTDAYQDYVYIWMTYAPGSPFENYCTRIRLSPTCGGGNTGFWTLDETIDMIATVRVQATKDGQFQNTRNGRWLAGWQLGTTAVPDRDRFTLGFFWLNLKLYLFYRPKPLEFSYKYGRYQLELTGQNCFNEKGKRDEVESTGSEKLLEFYNSLQA